MHELVQANLDRLRTAEPLAWAPTSRDDMLRYTVQLLGQYAMDRAVPCVIRSADRVVGVASLAVDPYLGQASLGYWIDAGFEGRGIVRRAASVLVGVARERRAARVEIRTRGRQRPEPCARGTPRLRARGDPAERVAPRPRRIDVAVYGLVS